MRLNVRYPGCCHLPVLTALQKLQSSRIVMGGLLLAAICLVLVFGLIEMRHIVGRGEELPGKRPFKKLTKPVKTNWKDSDLHYGIVVDCGSSGSRIYVYYWPPHSGNPQELLNIQQLRQKNGAQVVKKIEPGLSAYADEAGHANIYLNPLLQYAAEQIPKEKHKETPLYILATAGLRLLSKEQQNAIMNDLTSDIPLDFNFLFTENHVEVISGKQEGIYAWIAMNYSIKKFEHMVGEDPINMVDIPGYERKTHVRKRTTGIIDMGGGSTQIAFEVPQSVSFGPKEDVAQSLLAEFSLGCQGTDLDHKYRLYVATFLGFGGNEARRRYEKLLVSSSLLKPIEAIKSTNTTSMGYGAYYQGGTSAPTQMQYLGESDKLPLVDPCSPPNLMDTFKYNGQDFHLKGSGNYLECQKLLRPLLNDSQPCVKEPCSMNGVYQPELNFRHSEFYGFSEFFYTMDDILHMAGPYDFVKFQKSAMKYCETDWIELEIWFKKGLHPNADKNRYRLQCFKSAWMTTVLHDGLKFPKVFKGFTSAQLVDNKEVHWSLGSLLYKTKYYPLSEIQRHESHHYRPPWAITHLPQSYNILILCFIIVVAAILVYLRRLRIVRTSGLRRVPTMSYFMTDQNQMEEGISIQSYGKLAYS